MNRERIPSIPANPISDSPGNESAILILGRGNSKRIRHLRSHAASYTAEGSGICGSHAASYTANNRAVPDQSDLGTARSFVMCMGMISKSLRSRPADLYEITSQLHGSLWAYFAAARISLKSLDSCTDLFEFLSAQGFDQCGRHVLFNLIIDRERLLPGH